MVDIATEAAKLAKPDSDKKVRREEKG